MYFIPILAKFGGCSTIQSHGILQNTKKNYGICFYIYIVSISKNCILFFFQFAASLDQLFVKNAIDQLYFADTQV